MITSPKIPRIAVTLGEPAGIGPDLCIQLAQLPQACELIFIGDPELLKQRAADLKLPLTLTAFDPGLPPSPSAPAKMTVLAAPLNVAVACGQLNPANSAYVLNTLTLATAGCLTHGFDAMVTGPVHKAVINEAGFAFSGHTEFIAAITGGDPVMMLATAGLKVALVTTHLPLSKVCAAITREKLAAIIRVLNHDLQQYFGHVTPRILVCGLNPHAGENGHLGLEEIDIIQPVLENLRAEGLLLQGPLPADTLFTPKYLNYADAVLAMYHDQGLPVLKYKGFGNAVNITLGLPIIRTSVDHGTALDLAGTGKADIGSLLVAIQTALDMTLNHSSIS
ncbi:MAG: 4-hydroxythreonine-4-phosphate dehydrogenase PdxA [Methylococcaceae bacterium]|nr:4-hydroxythreonine-4-phosphate dehydrogenase PdxA [Methylococcaceae bacterium]